MVQLVNVGLRNGSGALPVMIGYIDGDDSALAVFEDAGIVVEFSTRVLAKLVSVFLSQIETIHDSFLHCPAAKHSDEQCARAFDSEQIAGDRP